MRAAWRSDIGRKKRVNEDSVLVDPEAGLFLLADGMSGLGAGKRASETAVMHAHAFLKERMDRVSADDEALRLLDDAVSHADGAVKALSRKNPKFRGMGTTLMVLWVRGGTAYLSHVGDSRAYCLREGLERITTDHSMQHRLEDFSLRCDLFFFGPARVLTQALGPSETIDCAGHCLGVGPGDVLLLCSDGLTDMLSRAAIREILEIYGADIEAAASALVEAANRMGGKDNVTVILVSI